MKVEGCFYVTWSCCFTVSKGVCVSDVRSQHYGTWLSIKWVMGVTDGPVQSLTSSVARSVDSVHSFTTSVRSHCRVIVRCLELLTTLSLYWCFRSIGFSCPKSQSPLTPLEGSKDENFEFFFFLVNWDFITELLFKEGYIFEGATPWQVLVLGAFINLT